MSLTNFLILLNAGAFAWELTTGGLTSDSALVAHGALVGVLVRHGEWWRIVSGAFLHGGYLHVGLNMFALYQVGTFVEFVVGPLRMLSIYLIAMLGSGLAVTFFQPDVPTVGASGAIFGLFGALVAIGLRMGARGRALIGQTLPIIIINLLFGFSVPNISNAGHIGGLISGFLAGFLLYMIERAGPAPVVVDAATGEPAEAEYLPPEEPAHPS